MSISLSKNQTISLSKQTGASLTSVTLGVGWDVARSKGFLGLLGGGGSIDLDASALLFDANRKLVDVVWFGKLKSDNRAVLHSGDNLTGAGAGDDESIRADLLGLPANVETIVLTVNSFRGQTFEKVENAYGRIVDNSTGKELARFNISDSGPHTGIILASLKRQGGDWVFTAIGERAAGRTVHDLQAPAAALI